MSSSFLDIFKIFKSYFSMSDLQKEFASSVTFEFFGDELSAMAAASAINPDVEDLTVRPFPSSPDECRPIASSSFSLFFLDEDMMTIESLGRIFKSVPREMRRKIICCVKGSPGRVVRDNVESLFPRMSLKRPVWYSDDDSFLDAIVGYLGKSAYSAARIYPGLRDALCDSLSLRTSAENAGISLVSSIPAEVPVIGSIAGVFAVPGETLVITANQIRLTMRIAGIYGAELDFFERMKELWPVLAASFGWKSVSRTLAGLVPVAGPVMKAGISFAGTCTAGFVAKCCYKEGRLPNVEEVRKVYNDSIRRFSSIWRNYGRIFFSGRNDFFAAAKGGAKDSGRKRGANRGGKRGPSLFGGLFRKGGAHEGPAPGKDSGKCAGGDGKPAAKRRGPSIFDALFPKAGSSAKGRSKGEAEAGASKGPEAPKDAGGSADAPDEHDVFVDGDALEELAGLDGGAGAGEKAGENSQADGSGVCENAADEPSVENSAESCDGDGVEAGGSVG